MERYGRLALIGPSLAIIAMAFLIGVRGQVIYLQIVALAVVIIALLRMNLIYVKLLKSNYAEKLKKTHPDKKGTLP